MTLSPSTFVYKVCELNQSDQPMTLNFAWHGSRRLPTERWLMAEPFNSRVGGRVLGLAGFSAFRSLPDCEAFYRRCAEGRRVAIFQCEAKGVMAHPGGLYDLCREIRVGPQMSPTEIAAPQEESPGS